MKKKLDTRFPAARIKKIMQADEEVGKIASATPVLISKALELFLQDLCDRTYAITLKKGAKTMNPHHLKECVRKYSVFDFLQETVSRVPDLDVETGGGSDTGRRRKAVEKDNDESCEEDSNKRSRSDPSSSRGRGRGRGRGRKSSSDKVRHAEPGKLEENEASSSPQHIEAGSPQLQGNGSSSSPQHIEAGSPKRQGNGADKENATSIRCPKDFDLNMELNENGEVAVVENNVDEDIQEMSLCISLRQNQNVFQPEDDYDCED